ncbi:hypothetical protein IMSAGC014_00075 [Bacteroidaceae bacterium]|nr:hypothetical protein IMSAGC014_00075 [Bacteroidaceae bacterium]
MHTDKIFVQIFILLINSRKLLLSSAMATTTILFTKPTKGFLPAIEPFNKS